MHVLALAALAALGVVWTNDPAARPVIDGFLWAVVWLGCFRAGVAADRWLDRLENVPGRPAA